MYVKFFLILCGIIGVLGQHGILTAHGDGSNSGFLKVPLGGNDIHKSNAVVGGTFDEKNKLSSATGGLAYSNAYGHGVSLTGTHEPGFGERLTATGKVNIFHNDNHNLDVKAFATRNMPDLPRVPDFNTVGGGVDYMFKDKVGASLSAAHTDLIDRNDYSVGGKLNVFRTPDTSLDFNAGYKKFDTPFIKSNWEPNFSFSLSKYF